MVLMHIWDKDTLVLNMYISILRIKHRGFILMDKIVVGLINVKETQVILNMYISIKMWDIVYIWKQILDQWHEFNIQIFKK